LRASDPLFRTEQNLVIHRDFNKGSVLHGGLIDHQAFLSFSFQNFPESFPTPAELLVKVKAAVQHAERLIGAVNPRQLLTQPGVASQLPSNENPVPFLALA
jgi:hypothetical protein